MKSQIVLNATSSCKYGACDGSGIILKEDKAYGVIGCECECRKELIHENRVKFAKIPDEFTKLTVNSFRTDLYKNEAEKAKAVMAKQACVRYIKQFDVFQEQGKGLYFFSETKGSGKTRLAISVGNALMQVQKLRTRYITTLDLLGEIKKTYNNGSDVSESDVINAVNSVDCLILDDVGVEDGERPWIKEKMFQVLDYRMTRKKITIFTSNVPVIKLKHDDRIKNRVERMAVPIMMPEESIRSQLAEKENDELTKILFE